MAEDFGVAVAVLIAEHGDRLVPSGINDAVLWVAGGGTAAWNGDGVTRLSESGEEMVGGGAASVFSDINDESVLTCASGIEFFLEFLEAGIIHGADVEVAEFADGDFIDMPAVVFYPLII